MKAFKRILLVLLGLAVLFAVGYFVYTGYQV